MSDSAAAVQDRLAPIAPVSRETAERLLAYVDLLTRWQARINLIGPRTLPAIWTRHIADSLQVLRLAPQARIWVDLGSGAGLPGLVIALALDSGPERAACVHLVESDQRKAAFLREAIRITGAPARLYPQRIETVLPAFLAAEPPIQAVTARALAPLKDLLAFVAPLVEKGCVAIFPKGRDVEVELTEATRYWNIVSSSVASLVEPDSTLLLVRGLGRRQPSQRIAP